MTPVGLCLPVRPLSREKRQGRQAEKAPTSAYSTLVDGPMPGDEALAIAPTKGQLLDGGKAPAATGVPGVVAVSWRGSTCGLASVTFVRASLRCCFSF